MFSLILSYFGSPYTGSNNDYLDFLDKDLTGVVGAKKVVRQLRSNPNCSALNLNSNLKLGDEGFKLIMEELRLGKNKLETLQASGCALGNDSLRLVAEILLTPSDSNPLVTLTHLNLAGNLIGAGRDWEISALTLGRAISSPNSSLRYLSLTSNPIGKGSLTPLLDNLQLETSRLCHIQLSNCELNVDSAEPIAKWLANPQGGGKTLCALDLNGNRLSTPGVRRISRSIISGECSGLIHLSFFSNEQPNDSLWRSLIQTLELHETEEEVLNWSTKLTLALHRNQVALEETQKSAFQLLSLCRTLLNGNPTQAKSPTELIRDQVESLSISSTTLSPSNQPIDSSVNPATTPSTPPFPFFRLPNELQIYVLRCTLLLDASSVAPLYPTLSSTPFPGSIIGSYESTPTNPMEYKMSALSERQVGAIISLGVDRKTLNNGQRCGEREKEEILLKMRCNVFER